jgi:hypothetical protein
MPRYFTVDEARAALPFVGRSLREAAQAKSRSEEAGSSLRNLAQRILMNGGVSVDTTLAEAWRNQYDSNETALKSALERLEELGVLVKDLEAGLADFPTLFEGEEVYLCWRADEADIAHWHGVSEGFAGRKPIDRHFLEHHKGE